jgi:hypothetical protein
VTGKRRYIVILFLAYSVDTTIHMLHAGVFCDITYVRIKAACLTSFGPWYGNGSTLEGAHVLILTGDVTAKLPVVIKDVTLWTGVGLRYAYNLLVDVTGDWEDDRTSDDSFHDLFLLMEVGGDTKLWGWLTVGGSFSLNYDLIPEPNIPSGSTSLGFVLEFSLHVGFALN